MDWWSLGIIAFELLIGHTPFVSSTNEAISYRMIRERIEREPPRLAKLRNTHQNMDKVTDLIQKLLIKDPKQRLGRRTKLILFSKFISTRCLFNSALFSIN